VPKFQIVAPHLPSECEQAFNEILAHDPSILEETWMGCPVGDHTVYGVVDAATGEDVAGRLPPFVRNRTRVVEVERPSVEQIREHFNQSV
jgi:hypothetical protein